MAGRGALLLFGLLALASAGAAYAQDRQDNHLATFLRTGEGARYLSLGSSGAAAAEGVEAGYWNPAGLGVLRGWSLTGTVATGLDYDRQNAYGAVGWGSERMALAFSWIRGATSGIPAADAQGNLGDSFTFSENAFIGSIGAQAGAARLGASAKFLYQDLGTTPNDGSSSNALGFGLDLGAQYSLTRFARVGLALRNLLGQIGNQSEGRANQVPADLRFGLAFEFVDGLLLTSDLEAVRDNSSVVLHLGGEFSAPLGNGMNAAARLGINGGRATGGLGFGVGVMRLDYAYVVEPEAFLGQYHLFSLTARFGVHREVTREEGSGDLDHDGFPDAEDACPGDPEDFDGFEDYDGCPDLDNDGDGILDLDDYCPDQPEDVDGFEDADGCPDPDNDGDGILDEADRCPGEAETANGYQDEDGCPDEVSIAFPPVEVSFGPGNAALPPGRNTGLDEVAGIMIRYPEVRIEVQGHTDGQGGEEANLRLSQERANAVKAYLVKRGVDPGRIVATGYGEAQPIASNDTPEGRAENRRIVFLVLEP